MSINDGTGLFRQLLESAPDAMVIADEAGRIVLVNAQAKELFGYQGHEILGKPIEVLIPERFRPQHAQLRQGYAAAPVVRSMNQGRVLKARRKNGDEFSAEISLSPLQSDEGRLILSAIRDVTERERHAPNTAARLALTQSTMKSMQHEMAGLRSQLSTTMEDVSRFSALVREPLVEMLDPSRSLDAIVGSAQQLQRIVDRWVAYASLDPEQTVQSLDTGALCDLAFEQLKPLIEETGAILTRDELPAVVGHPERIKEVFFQLLKNSLQFRGAFVPEIHVSAERSGGWWKFAVRDNGRGMDPSQVESAIRLFVRFESEGDGVGLALCQRIVRTHGGRIWCESEPSRGTTVFFTLVG